MKFKKNQYYNRVFLKGMNLAFNLSYNNRLCYSINYFIKVIKYLKISENKNFVK